MRIKSLMLAWICVVFTGCMTSRTLEYKEVVSPSVRYDPQFNCLRVAGAYTPGWTVQRVVTEQEGRDLYLRMVMGRAEKMEPGQFDYAIDLQEDISQVYFGDQKQRIWKDHPRKGK